MPGLPRYIYEINNYKKIDKITITETIEEKISK